MKAAPTSRALPLPVRTALRKLGGDLRDARLRRRISTAIMAQRALMSRMTLHKLERGDGTVSMGAYATVLFVLGMLLDEERLPKRIRSKSRRTQPPKSAGSR
jgi:transcriptional regulator with XRE-family HTH domain